MEQQMVMVEMGGIRKSVLASQLAEVQKMAQEMYSIALKAGFPEEYAKELFTLWIVKD